MIPDEGAAVIRLVDQGSYEEALGVGVGAGREAINRAHVQMLHRFRSHPPVREALNRAKGGLLSEDDGSRGRRLFRLSMFADALPYLRAAAAGGHAADLRRYAAALLGLERYEEAVPLLESVFENGHDDLDGQMLGTCRAMLRRRGLGAAIADLVADLRAALVRR